jgi:hypothetical protein
MTNDYLVSCHRRYQYIRGKYKILSLELVKKMLKNQTLEAISSGANMNHP